MRVKDLSEDEVRTAKHSWIENFVPKGIDAQSIYLDCYLWHIFSYEKTKCVSGESAIQSLNDVEKDNLYIFYQHIDIGYLIEDAKSFMGNDLSQFISDPNTWDIYVTDEHFSWTYVETHEGNCGPYYSDIVYSKK